MKLSDLDKAVSLRMERQQLQHLFSKFNGCGHDLVSVALAYGGTLCQHPTIHTRATLDGKVAEIVKRIVADDLLDRIKEIDTKLRAIGVEASLGEG